MQENILSKKVESRTQPRVEELPVFHLRGLWFGHSIRQEDLMEVNLNTILLICCLEKLNHSNRHAQ